MASFKGDGNEVFFLEWIGVVSMTTICLWIEMG